MCRSSSDYCWPFSDPANGFVNRSACHRNVEGHEIWRCVDGQNMKLRSELEKPDHVFEIILVIITDSVERHVASAIIMLGDCMAHLAYRVF